MNNRSEATTLRRMDLNLLPLFDALMRERSVTRAGQALFLSQPATSAALARLRATINDELFIRHGNVLEPTPRAEQLMSALSPLLQEIAGLLAEATPFDPATDTRTFRLGLGQDVAIAARPLTLRFRREAPHCQLVIRSSNFRNVADMLESREIGSAIGFAGDHLPAATKQKILRRGGFRVMRDVNSPGPVDLDMFCERPHVLVTPRGDLDGFVDDILQTLGRSRRVVIGIPDFSFLESAITGTDNLCTVSDVLANAIIYFRASSNLVADPTPFETPESVVHMVWRTALDHDPAEMWFRALIQEVLNEERARLSHMRLSQG